MPGAGEIGGGSCKVKVTTYDNNPSTPDSTTEACDQRMPHGQPVDVYINLPGEGWKGPYAVDAITKIEFRWPNKPKGMK